MKNKLERKIRRLVLRHESFFGSCVVFLVHGTILQQWSSLLKNSASIEKRKICQWLLKNYTSDCWRIVPATVDQSCQWLLNNRASDCWIIVPATFEELYQWLLKNYASDCWRIMPVTVDEWWQWLLNSRASCFFLSSSNFTLAKSLPVFRVNTSIIIIDYFNSGSQLSKLQVYWLIIIFIFSLYTFYQPL